MRLILTLSFLWSAFFTGSAVRGFADSLQLSSFAVFVEFVSFQSQTSSLARSLPTSHSPTAAAVRWDRTTEMGPEGQHSRLRGWKRPQE